MTQRQITRCAVGEAFALLRIALVAMIMQHLALPPAVHRALPTVFAAGFGLLAGLQIGLGAAYAAGMILT